MARKERLTSNRKYKLMRHQLVKLYGKSAAQGILTHAQNKYAESFSLCNNATDGEWTHLEGTILPTVAVYKALLEIDPANALNNTHTMMMEICKLGGKFMAGLLHVPGMKSFFMWCLPKMAVKMFGESCGFKQKVIECNPHVLKMDILACPYCKYAQMLGCPEVTYLFCESDVAVYGNLPGIRFIRTQTIGTGGKKCDFAFKR